MNLNFLSHRNRSLDVALLSGNKLQSAISSVKHGVSATFAKGTSLTVSHLLYSKPSRTRTLAIDLDSSKYMVLYKWYSLCTVHVRDVMLDLLVSGSNVVICLNKMAMSLYCITLEEVMHGLSMYIKTRCNIWSTSPLEIHVDNAPSDIVLKPIRITALDCYESDFDVHAEEGTVVTVFGGDRFSNVMSYCDITLSSNPEITSSYLGRAQSLLLYTKYVTGENSHVYLSSIMCSEDTGCNTYDNMCSDDPLKRLSIKDQMGTIVDSTLGNIFQEIRSTESKLISGVNL